MTILAATVRRNAVHIVTDTRCRLGDRSGETTKCHPVPHLQAVVAGTGHLEMGVVALHGAMTFAGRFDALAASMPSILATGFRQLRPTLAAAGADISRQAILLAGWSPGRAAMRAVWFERQDEVHGFTATEVEGFCVSPWEGPLPEPPQGVADLVALGRRQVAVWRRARPDAAFGGELIATTLTRSRIVTEAVFDLDRDAPITAGGTEDFRNG